MDLIPDTWPLLGQAGAWFGILCAAFALVFGLAQLLLIAERNIRYSHNGVTRIRIRDTWFVIFACDDCGTSFSVKETRYCGVPLCDSCIAAFGAQS